MSSFEDDETYRRKRAGIAVLDRPAVAERPPRCPECQQDIPAPIPPTCDPEEEL